MRKWVIMRGALVVVEDQYSLPLSLGFSRSFQVLGASASETPLRQAGALERAGGVGLHHIDLYPVGALFRQRALHDLGARRGDVGRLYKGIFLLELGGHGPARRVDDHRAVPDDLTFLLGALFQNLLAVGAGVHRDFVVGECCGRRRGGGQKADGA